MDGGDPEEVQRRMVCGDKNGKCVLQCINKE